MSLAGIRTCCIASLLLPLSARASFADEETAASFRSQAPIAWSKAVGLQDRLQGEYTKKMVELPSEKVLYFVTGEFKSIRGHKYLQYHLTESDGHSYWAAFGLNPEHGFVLDRNSADTNWRIAAIEQQTKEFATDRLARQGAVRHAGFSVDGQSLLWTVRQPSFRLKDATLLRKDGMQLVAITFETDDSLHRDRRLQRGTVTLMPERSWAVHEYEVNVLAGGEELKVKGRIKYDGQLRGIPLASRSETWVGVTNGDYSHHEAIAFSGIQRCKAPVSDFTLTGFVPIDIATSQDDR